MGPDEIPVSNQIQDPTHSNLSEPDSTIRPKKKKRKNNCPSPLNPIATNSIFSFGLELRSELEPNSTPRFGSSPPAVEDQSEEGDLKRTKISSSIDQSSFSFFNLDHNSDIGSPEPTPKFGSFNFVAAQIEESGQTQIPTTTHHEVDAAADGRVEVEGKEEDH